MIFYCGDITNDEYIFNLYKEYSVNYDVLFVLPTNEYGLKVSSKINHDINPNFVSLDQLNYLLNKENIDGFNTVKENVSEFIIKPKFGMNSEGIKIKSLDHEQLKEIDLKKYTIQSFYKGSILGVKYVIWEYEIIGSIFINRYFNEKMIPIGADNNIKISDTFQELIKSKISLIHRKLKIKAGVFDSDIIIDETNNSVNFLEIVPFLDTVSSVNLFQFSHKYGELHEIFFNRLMNKEFKLGPKAKMKSGFLNIFAQSTKGIKEVMIEKKQAKAIIIKNKIDKLEESLNDQVGIAFFQIDRDKTILDYKKYVNIIYD